MSTVNFLLMEYPRINTVVTVKEDSGVVNIIVRGIFDYEKDERNYYEVHEIFNVDDITPRFYGAIENNRDVSIHSRAMSERITKLNTALFSKMYFEHNKKRIEP